MPGPFVVSWHAAQQWNEILSVLVLNQKMQTPGSKLGVGTGWSGPKTLFELEHTASLQRFIRDALKGIDRQAFELSGWGNVMYPGDVVGPHHHDRSHLGGLNTWAGVYYVTVPPGSGALIVEGQTIVPQAGQLVIFPSLAVHEVQPHESELLRISIAFNARTSVSH